jgi:putative ABC transport system permease protein
MDAINRVAAVFIVAARRLFSQRGLTLAAALGIAVAVALVTSIPLYADAVYSSILRQELTRLMADQAATSVRPPFGFLFRYLAAMNEPLKWQDLEPVDQFFMTRAGAQLGLPQKLVTHYVKTDTFRLYPDKDAAYADSKQPLDWVSLGTVADLEKHISFVEGSFPAAAGADPASYIDVLASEAQAQKLGLHAGELFRAMDRQSGKIQLPLRVAGIWKANDPSDEFWFYKPDAFADVLLVPQATFSGRIGAQVKDEVYFALWYVDMDGSGVRSDDTTALAARITSVQQQGASLLPGTELDTPALLQALNRYQSAAQTLTVLLYAFSIPIFGLIVAFISIVTGLSVNGQRNEIAVLRSRGVSSVRVVGVSVLEGIVVGVFAVAIGLPAGIVLAQWIGRSRSFLDFTGNADLQVVINAPAVRFGVLVAALAILALAIPTFQAARHTIITYKQERARSLRAPWWQRAWLDVLLLIPTGYGAYLLQRQGSIVVPVTGKAIASFAGDPLENPLLFLVPALAVFALSLLLLRVLPLIMGVVAWFANAFGDVGSLLASRYVSRSLGFYTPPLLLLVLTLSLSVFTASLAQTLDTHLYDQMYYQAGADISLTDRGQQSAESVGTSSTAGSGALSSAATATGAATGDTAAGPRWTFLPVSTYLQTPGVQAATRVGRYEATVDLGGRSLGGAFLGVDRAAFGQVAFWRDDFAADSLGDLMNALGRLRDGVLLPNNVLAQQSLAVGQRVRVEVRATGQDTPIQLDLRIVGGFDLFPTWYPDDGLLVVGNLDYFFERAGGKFPYDVWLRTDPTANVTTVVDHLPRVELVRAGLQAALPAVVEQQARPDRQGLFGVLSVGFIAAALATVLGFLLYAMFSFRRRFVELGVLRAIGLSATQMTMFLAWELAFLVLVGISAGTGIGLLISQAFIPYLQVGVGSAAHVPPFIVETPWPTVIRVAALFGLLFLAALAGLATLLLRMRIFEAIKLGETE